MVEVIFVPNTIRISEGTTELIELVATGNNEIPVAITIDASGSAIRKLLNFFLFFFIINIYL